LKPLKSRSYIGKILSTVKYSHSDISQLERMIADINQKAMEKSESLKRLKNQLDNLNQSFGGSGQAELTPFPKKIRDLAKRFGLHFGESEQSSFSMEYHGMGTRSWASILTVKAFVELMADNFNQEAKPFFPIIAVEEPESHLHPNAQRTLYQQMKQNSLSQVVISTHSPYLPTVSSPCEIRMLQKTDENVQVSSLFNLNIQDKHKLHRIIVRFRGEMFFSRVLILVEGFTEELLIPAMFERYFGSPIFEKGVNCIGVNGKNYKPFLNFAFSFDIPVCIISDNDGTTKEEVTSQIHKIEEELELNLEEKKFAVEFLTEDCNIEHELIEIMQLREEVVEALTNQKGLINEQYARAKKKELTAMDNRDLLKTLTSNKPSYADFLSDVLSSTPNDKEVIPKAIIKAFETIKCWIE